MDLGEWWKARRWRALLDLIDLLPPASRLSEARLHNPDEAPALLNARLAADDDSRPWSPPVSQYDLHALLLREIANSVAQLGGAQRHDLLPGPRTAVDDEEHNRRRWEAYELIKLATPHLAEYFRPATT